jgi:hypothetical protein
VGQVDEKGGASAELAVYLDAAAGVLDHALDHVEANARALDVVVEALEHAEELGQLVLGEAEAIVVHFEHRVARAHVGPHVDAGQAVERYLTALLSRL